MLEAHDGVVSAPDSGRLRVDLTFDELADLHITLGGELRRLSEEIAQSTSQRYHDVLRRRRDRLSHLIRVLSQPLPGARPDLRPGRRGAGSGS